LKRILPLLAAVFLLSSCILVGDFGPYWDKGTIDPAILGWWQSPANKDKVKTRVMNHAGTYQIDEFDQNGWERPKDAEQARTLQIGNYRFFMLKIHDHGRWVTFGILRYKIEGDKMWMYTLNAKKMGVFLAREYPNEKNITAATCGGKKGCLGVHGSWVIIQKLDNNVYKILSSIPDTRAFWTLDKNSMTQKIQ